MNKKRSAKEKKITKVDKSLRDIFVTGTIDDVKNKLDDLIHYCALDVFYTHEIFKEVYPKFTQICPHPATFLGMLEMGSCYLPITKRWNT